MEKQGLQSLSTLVSEVATIETLLIESGGEITPEIEQILVVKELELPQKIDGYASVIERFDLISEFYKMKADQILRLSRAALQVSERCRENLKFSMITLDTKELLGNESKFKLSPTTPTVLIADESLVEDAYKITKTLVSVDKKKITEDLKLGVPVRGARLQENFTLRKYINRSGK